MAMGTRKIGPAVAAGCTMVVKPAEQTPLSMLALAEILQEAGPARRRAQRGHHHATPARSMEPLIRDGRARKLSFTGSTAVGRKLLEQCADQVLRTSMELGGNAPFLVFEDADLDAAVDGRDAGQDAQHRRGLHRGQPVLRARRGRRRVRPPAGRADGGAARRPRASRTASASVR